MPYMEPIEVIDLFCGVGGLSLGFKEHGGFKVVMGIDADESCKYAYQKNINAPFLCSDVRHVAGIDLARRYSRDSKKVLIGCAPCQAFSSYNKKNQDYEKWALLSEFARLIGETGPDVVSMENVVGLKSFNQGKILSEFISKIKELGYNFVDLTEINVVDLGAPQERKRLVLVASKDHPIKFTYVKKPRVTVQEVLSTLPKLDHGEVSVEDKYHRSAKLSDLNLKRIKSTPTGGSWIDWPEDLVLNCHKKQSGKSYKSVYGRMRWDKSSPTITTQFTGYGNGRFGHPEQNRALTIREGAILQTFPPTFEFTSPEEEINLSQVSRHIGNAVPPILSRAIANAIFSHLIN